MVKRRLCILIAFFFLLTGCSSLNMTQAESGQVAEYIAYSLLKYHKSPNVFVTETSTPDGKLDNTQEATPSKVPASAPTQGTVNNTPSTPQNSPTGTMAPEKNEKSAGELFGSKDFQISVHSKGLYTSYPKNSSSTYFSLSANKNKKLFVLELKAKNTGSTSEVFKTSGTGLSYTLNDESSNKALVTILEHDIHFIKETVKPGKSIKSLVFFEVDKDFDEADAKLTLAKSGDTVSISVK